MTKITHVGAGNGKSISASNTEADGNQRVYKVEDASDINYVIDPPLAGKESNLKTEDEIDAKMAEFEDDPISLNRKDEKVQSANSKMLEDLIFMGRSSRVVDVFNHKFELCTLSHKENHAVARRLFNLGDAADLFSVRLYTLSHALKSVDGVQVDEIEVDFEYENTQDKLFKLFDNMQNSIITKLYSEYENLLKETEEETNGESIKN